LRRRIDLVFFSNTIVFSSIRNLALNELDYIKQQGTGASILEAGCGRHWPYSREELDTHLVGIDMDRDALALRNDLDEVVYGDIRSSHFDPETFDVIYSSFVLEHVPSAESALINFSQWVKRGGIIIIRVPDRDSVYGFLTRMTPLWFHRWAKRWIFGDKNAGKPGYGPYPTHHEPIIGAKGMAFFAAENGLELVEVRPFDSLKGWVYHATRIISLLSFNKLSADHVNLLYVLRRTR